MPKDVLTPGYIKSFICIADKCEDTCCQTWDVRFDKTSYENLRNSLAGNQQEVIFDKNVSRYKESDNSSYYAYIRMRDDGYCPFLTAQSSCDLHKQFGIDVLSDVCAFYPRVINQINDHYELNGALSCPEMVRKCINQQLPDIYYTSDTDEIFPRQTRFTVQRKYDPGNSDTYQQYFMLVRDAMYNIVKSSQHDITAQLYSLASYTSRLSVFYHSGCGTSRRNEFTRVQNQTLKDQARGYEFLNKIESDNVFTEGFITSLINTNISQSKNRKYTALAELVIAFRENLYIDHEVESIFELKDEIQVFINDTVDNTVTAYLANCLYREWFITMPSPFAYIFMIIVRLAMIRYVARLYLRHYIVKNKITNYSNKDMTPLMVEVIYLHARSIDHNIPYLQVVYQALQEQDMFNMDFLLPLIKCS